eukprot:jgi/Tetstr1/461505/TSEL_006611.t1
MTVRAVGIATVHMPDADELGKQGETSAAAVRGSPFYGTASGLGPVWSGDPYRSAACPRSDRRLTCRANCIAAHLYDEALLFVWRPVWSVVWARVQQ